MDICKRLPRFAIDFALRCSPGEVISIVGPSGSGKTTLLRCIAGFITPDEGRILLGPKTLFDSESGTKLPTQHRRVGLVTQEYMLFPHMSVLENVAFAYTGGPEPMSLLEAGGIANLSGERQKAALCRVLAMQPDMLLLDEPFSALDLENRIRLQEMVWEVGKQHSLPVLYVSHDLESAVRYTDHCVAINEGKEDPHWLDRQLQFLSKKMKTVVFGK